MASSLRGGRCGAEARQGGICVEIHSKVVFVMVFFVIMLVCVRCGEKTGWYF